MGRHKSVEIYCTNNAEWDRMIDEVPIDKRDIYFTREYHKLFERILGSKAEMFVYKEGEKFGIYTYLKTQIIRDYLYIPFFDIETVYGYGGPIVSDCDKEFTARFEEAFMKYCDDSNIVAEFVRFHPLLKNETVFSGIDAIHNRMTITVDLSMDEDDIWASQLSSGNRNVIRKCINNGLYVEEITDYSLFYEIYRETMQRVSAESFYYFDENMIKDMLKGDGYHLLACKKDKDILAVAIFMGYGKFFHYHLSGSRREAMKYNPNNILLWEAIKFGKKQGHRVMHLGGGLSDSSQDNLFKFKAHFSKQCNDFYIGKRIHNREIYDRLISEWENRTGRKSVKLLQYKENN